MSYSGHGSEAPGHRSSNFAQTCNLLSRYVKERGSLKNLNIEIGGEVESLEAIVKPGSSFAASLNSSRNKRAKISSSSSSPSLGQQSSAGQEDASNKNSPREKGVGDRKPAQLTIFYSGKVLVFDDYPMKKARELVSIAKKSSSQMSYGILPYNLDEKSNSNHAARESLPPRPQSKEKQPDLAKQPAAAISSNTSKDKIKSSHLSPQSDANASDVSDLPIARRSSIRRFLEKRKDRASARMPYHHHEQPASSPSSSWKGDGGLDLNL